MNAPCPLTTFCHLSQNCLAKMKVTAFDVDALGRFLHCRDEDRFKFTNYRLSLKDNPTKIAVQTLSHASVEVFATVAAMLAAEENIFPRYCTLWFAIFRMLETGRQFPFRRMHCRLPQYKFEERA
ncbi:hypothetical protein T10_13641 [Trichinella papuae]|uniref:Uncharacterized protein n=1 Tax=Trichinella papuae TaxID=268474 RepID=A0A0V1N3K3_9BILA|nr:hypothetical protein T10_13641 [Trichinella papuae]